MKTSTRTFPGFLVLLFSILYTYGQDQKTDRKEPVDATFSYIMTDVSFISDAVFMGRRDTITAPYVFPSIGYYDASGLFIQGAASYLTKTEEGRFDLFLVGAGYRFSHRQFSGILSGTAYFYNEASYNVQAETAGNLSVALGYDLKFLQTGLYLGTYFGTEGNTDLILGFKLERNIYSASRDILVSPSVSAFAGSQYFYQTYYQTSRLGSRKGKGSGNADPVLPPNETISIAEAEKFKLLNIELSLPVYFFKNQFIFNFTPTLSLPQSPASVTDLDTVYEEDLEPVFYFSAGISYWIKTSGKSPKN